MIPQTRKYFVITVHFGPPEKTDALVTSLTTGTVKPDKIIVVDHADETYVPKHNPSVAYVIRPQHNYGYAGGLNIGLGALVSLGANSEDIVICVNNDAVVAPDDLRKIRNWADTQTALFVAGPVMGTVNYITGRADLSSRRIIGSHWAYASYIHGSCLVAPLKVYGDVKGLPEKFFLYWEDVAFSARAAARGARLQKIPELEIRHPDNRQVSDSQLFYLVRNGAWYLEHSLPAPWRFYWYVRNRVRYVWHVLKKNTSIATALKAAIISKLGPVEKKEKNTADTVIGAVVVTHNNEGSIVSCLKSLERAGLKDIVVVDNASNDRTLSHVPSTIQVLKNKQNVGFGAAANQGAQILKNSYIFFLNPDAQLESSLNPVLNVMERDANIGIVGLGLYDEQGKVEPHSTGRFPTLLQLLLRKLRLSAPSTPDWVSAGAMVVRRKAWQQVDGFDPAFFMYWEDVDVCFRAHRRGWEVIHLPEVRVSHRRGGSLSDGYRKTQLYDASADRYFKKHYAWYIWGMQYFGRKIYRWLYPQVS